MGRRRRRKGAKRNGEPPLAPVEAGEPLEAREEAVVAATDPPAKSDPDRVIRLPSGDGHDDDTEDRVTDPGPSPEERLRVRVDYAETPRSASLVLVPSDDDPPPAEAEPPRRAADALPPRNRRSPPVGDSAASTIPIDPITEPRGRRFDVEAAMGASSDEAGGGPNKRPSGAPKPVFGQPLFSQEWGTAPSGTPTWKPGSPPVDPTRSWGPVWIVSLTALFGVALIVLWLAYWWE